MIPASPLTRPSARAVTAVPRTDGNSRVIRPVLGCQVYRARSGRLKGTLRRSVRDVLRKTGRGTSDLKKHHSGSRRGKGDNLALKKIGLDFGGHYRWRKHFVNVFRLEKRWHLISEIKLKPIFCQFVGHM